MDQQPQVVTQSVERGRREEGWTTLAGAAKLTAGLWRERRSRMPEEQAGEGRPSRGGGSTRGASWRQRNGDAGADPGLLPQEEGVQITSDHVGPGQGRLEV